MDVKDIAMVVFGIFSTAGLVISGYVALRGVKPKIKADEKKSELDESQTLLNYQKLAAEMQKMDADHRAENKLLSDRIDGQIMTTDFRVTVEIGKEPVFTQGKTTWENRNTIPTTPRRATGGLGARQ